MGQAAHSKWSASGFEQVMLCPGSKVMQQGLPDSTSKYAAEGTAAHQVLTWALHESRPAAAFIGRVIEADGFTFEVDEVMAGHAQTCADYAYDLAGDDGVIFADIRVNYSSYLGVPVADAWGTADVIVARGEEIMVVDFKYGMGVEVSAGYDVFTTDDGVEVHIPVVRKPNPQMALYALGALQAYQGLCGDFTRVRMAISQPRIKSAPSEYDLSVGELETWARSTGRSAVITALNATAWVGNDPTEFNDTYLRPGEKQCKFCRAKATCPKLRDVVADTTFDSAPADPDEFADQAVTKPGSHSDEKWLAACLSQADLIEDWCKSVRAEVERRLLAGDDVTGYKLVQGKRGNRAWSNKTEAEELMKTMRLKTEEMYELSLISPTSAEKLAPKFTKEGKLVPTKEGAPAPLIGPRQWPRLKALITQSEGKPHVAPVSDSRPALMVTPVADEFTDVTVEALA